MDSKSNEELINFQLNQVEIGYQLGINIKKKKHTIFNQKKIFKKIHYTFHENIIFLKEFFSKINFFSTSVFQLQSWFFFWFLNSIDFSGKILNKKIKINIINALIKNLLGKGSKNLIFFNIETLFPIYSSIISLSSLGGFSFIFKKKHKHMIYVFLRKLRISSTPKSSSNGEIDPRVNFSFIIIGSCLNFFTKNLFNDIFLNNEHFGSCDGGFGFDKFDESHGALTFCSICSFFFFQGRKQFGNTNPSLENWFYNKIKPFEFFFIGRISKIPDSCYFYWLGAISIICNFFFPIEFLNSLIYCKTRKYGGLSDQPSKIPDLYHTSYSLCGLSFYIFCKKTKKYREEMGGKFFYYLQLPKINPIMGIKESKSVLSFI